MADALPAGIDVDLPAIHMKPLDAIRPYWRNPRRNELAVDAVVESIQRYGMNQPLVLDAEDVIIVGDTRYRALRRLGVTEAPVIVRDLPAVTARAYRIADNKTHEAATWDKDRLVEELRDLPALADTMFFQPGEVDRLLGTLSSVAVPTLGGVAMPVLPPSSIRTDQLEVTCPECGEEFLLDRRTLA